MREISKERADELDSQWNAASDTQRLSLNRVSWLCVAPDTTYYESEPPPLEKKAAARIAELETALGKIISEFESVGGLNGFEAGIVDIATQALQPKGHSHAHETQAQARTV